MQRIDVANLKVYHLNDLIEEGVNLEVELENPTGESIFTILSTSGTTGNPKGVPRTHSSVLSTCFCNFNDEFKGQDLS